MYLTIAICDDEHLQVELVSKYITNNSTNKKLFNLIKAYSGEELLGLLTNNKIDIIFLDIDMKGMNGLEVAKEIRKTNEDIVIIYLTGYKGYALDAFEVRSLDYLIKPIYEQRFKDALEKAIKRIDEIRTYNTKKNFFMVRNKDEIIRIKFEEIYCFEKQHRNIKVYSNKGEFTYNGTLKELDKHLVHLDFLQCHQGYFVNMHKIFLFKKDEIIFKDIEKIVPVSRRFKKNIIVQLEKQLI